MPIDRVAPARRPGPTAGPGLLDRTRTGFLILNLANLGAVLLAMAGSDASSRVTAASVAAGLLIAAGDWQVYRRRHVPVLNEIGRAAAMIVASLSLPDVTMIVSLIFSAVMYRSLYGSHRSAAVRMAWYLATYTVVLLFAQHMHRLNTDIASALLLPLAAMVMSMVTMRVLYVAAGQRDRATQRQELLARAAADLIGIPDQAAMSAVGWGAQRELLADEPGAQALLLVKSGDGYSVEGPTGPLNDAHMLDSADIEQAFAEVGQDFAVPHVPPSVVQLVPGARHWYFVGTTSSEEVIRILILAGAERLESDLVMCSEMLMRQTALAYSALQSRQQLHRQAWYDSLTELPNRKMFLQQLEQACDSARPGDRLAVLFVDLDGFKEVNDVYGHLAGDQLLATLGRRLAAHVGEPDLAARLGGDEFAILMCSAGTDQVVQDLVEALEHQLCDPVILGDGTIVSVGASIGAHIASDRLLADDLLQAADTAMYQAKAEHRRMRLASRVSTGR